MFPNTSVLMQLRDASLPNDCLDFDNITRAIVIFTKMIVPFASKEQDLLLYSFAIL